MNMDNEISKTIACLDSMIIQMRLRQISLVKLLAKEKGIDEGVLLAAIKNVSLELLKNNDLEY